MRSCSAGFRSLLAIALVLLVSFGVGGFFAIKALDEGTKDERLCTEMACIRARCGVRVGA
jgi:hypothetical protein